MKKFNFLKEISERKIPIDLIREIETETFLNTISDPEAREWGLEALGNCYNQYLSWRDDLFLERMLQIYEEDDLKQILDIAEDVQISREPAKYLLDGDKKYTYRKTENDL